jgi:hypothetical protein
MQSAAEAHPLWTDPWDPLFTYYLSNVRDLANS